MKKLLITAMVALPSLAALADTTDTNIITISDVSDIFETATTNMTSLVSAAMPVVISFVGGGLVIWGAFALLRLIKRGFSAGKGR